MKERESERMKEKVNEGKRKLKKEKESERRKENVK